MTPTSTSDPDSVAARMREVAAQVVTPRFRLLIYRHELEKSPGELVAIAGGEAEVLLSTSQRDLMSDIPALGEGVATQATDLPNLPSREEQVHPASSGV